MYRRFLYPNPEPRHTNPAFPSPSLVYRASGMSIRRLWEVKPETLAPIHEIRDRVSLVLCLVITCLYLLTMGRRWFLRRG